MRRTNTQNKAIHLYFKLLSDAFNDAGIDVKTALSEELTHRFTPVVVKELIWRRVQESMFNKKSTTELETNEIDLIFEAINNYVANEFLIDIPFPSLKSLMDAVDNYDNKKANSKKP